MQTRSDGALGLAEDLRSATLAPTRQHTRPKGAQGGPLRPRCYPACVAQAPRPGEGPRVRALLGRLAATASVGRPFQYIPCYPELTYEPCCSRYFTTRSGLPAALRAAPTWQNRHDAWSDSMQLRGGAGQAAAGRGEAEGALLHTSAALT